MKPLFRAIRYSTVGSFFAGIFFVIQGCTLEREGTLGVLLLILLQFCSGPVDTSGDGGNPAAFFAYVVNEFGDDVSVLDLTSNTNPGTDIPVGNAPLAIAITPDGAFAYVANFSDDDVSVIDVATNTNLGTDIAVGDVPRTIAITPDGAFAYVANNSDDDVSVIDIATNTNIGPDIPVGNGPIAIAIFAK